MLPLLKRKTKMSSGGKGSTPRPYSVDRKTFDANWDAIFKKNSSSEKRQKKSELQVTHKRTSNRA